MIVGIDARAATEEVAGGGRYVRELLRALAARGDDHRYVLYAREEWSGGLDARFSWRLLGRREPLWNLAAARAANRECEVFLSTNSYLTTWPLTIPAVPVVYDLVAYDSSLRPSRRSGIIERLTMPLAIRRAAGVVAISEATGRALVERFPAAAGRISVTPLAAAPALAPAGPPAQLPDRFVLAVGTLEPRKNLPRLVEAYRRLPAALQEEHPLVIVGRVGWEAGETLRALESLGDRCLVLGVLSDEELAVAYARCSVFCYPSLAEGFGLPVLEAMAGGAAVITSDRSSLPEVGGDAVAYVDPTSVDSIAAALEELLGDPGRRDDLGGRAAARARTFSWDRTAELTLQALDAAVRR